jgi:ornithine cyclodeaminase/alanine dehydrogenase-like protein (mu-crystallin family)
MAFALVRKIKKVKVHSPNKEHRELYAREMEKKLGIEVIPCANPEEASKQVDILSTCTNSRDPTVFARMLEPGMHLTQVSNEFADDVYRKIDVCAVGGPMSQAAGGAPIDDSEGFPTYLAGSLETLNKARGTPRSRSDRKKDFRGRPVPLVDLITSRARGRLNPEEISASSGVKVRGEDTVKGLQFVTVSSLVYDLVKRAGLGREVPKEWFLQDIRD